MKKLNIVVGILLLSVHISGCNNRNRNHTDTNLSASEDTIQAIDSLQTLSQAEHECDSILKSDTIAVPHIPSEKDLKELQTLILDRLQKIKGNPLQPNIYAIGLLPDAVEVYLEINTPYWQNEFSKYISSSPYIKFSGDSTPTPISELVDTLVELENVKLQPDRPSFPVNSKFATFTLSNESENNILFGEYYVIGYKGDDGLWYRLPHPDMWQDIGIELKPTGKHSIEAALTPILNNNQPGVYRLYKQIRFEEEKKKVWLMTEFFLE